jgi:hypothetical protein
MKIYEKKVKISNSEAKNNTPIINASEQILNELSSLNDKELKILIYVNQAILNVIIKNDTEAKKLLTYI